MKPAWKLAAALGGLGIAAALFGKLDSARGVRRQQWGLNQQHLHEFERKLKARKLPRLDERIKGSASGAFSPEVSIRPEGGFHGAPPTVTLASAAGARILYTLDGSIPDRYSPAYSGPIVPESSTVVRARVLQADRLPGNTATRTFLLEERPGLPAVSLVVDPVNLWNKYSGIYENPTKSGEEWIRQAEMEVHPGPAAASWGTRAKIRIHGGYSRTHPKKSFRVTFPAARPGKPDGILSNQGLRAERTVVLRSGGSNSRHRLRDELFSALFRQSGGVTSGFQPIALYLNARYWGIYDAREYLDEEFLASRFGEGRYEMLAFDSKNRNQWATPILGDGKHWKKTLRFFEEGDFSRPGDYARAGEILDLAGTIDYWIHNIYAANVDWPYNNMTVYRRVDGDGRWSWIAWDADAAFNYRGGKTGHRTLEWAIRDRVRNDLKHNFQKGEYEDEKTFLVSTLFVRKLLANPDFKDRFATRFCDLLNVHFRPEQVESLLDSIIALSRSELPRDWKRWGLSDSTYRADQDLMRSFIRERPAVVRGHLAQALALGEPYPVQAAFDTAAGRVSVNGLPLPDSPWPAAYHKGMRLRFSAVPKPGHVFTGWKGCPGKPSGAEMECRVDGPISVQASFAPALSALESPGKSGQSP